MKRSQTVKNDAPTSTCLLFPSYSHPLQTSYLSSTFLPTQTILFRSNSLRKQLYSTHHSCTHAPHAHTGCV
jgi:hypothetical protein